MTIEVDIVANETNIESALRKISVRLKTLEGESKAVANNISNIGVKSIDSKKISQEIRSLKTDLNKTNKEISNSVNNLSAGFSNLAKNITLALTGGALGAGFVAITSKFNDLENRIALVTGRTDDLVLVQEQLIKISAKTFNSLDGSVESFNRFGLALRDAGVETNTLLAVTENVQKAIAISGGSAASTSAAIYQLGQGLSAGALRGQELNSVLEQAPRIATAIADELGVTIGELRKVAEEGGITTKVVLNSLLNQGSTINDEFDRINPSISKASVVFLDAVTNYIGQLDKGLRLSQTVATGILKVSGSLNKASVDLDLRMAEKISGLNIVQTFKDILLVSGGIFNVLGAIVGRIGDSLPKVIIPVLTLFNQLYLSWISIPFVETISTISRALLDIRGGFLDLITLSDTVAGAIANVFTSETPQELRDNLDILAIAIDNAGKRWFNTFNYIRTLVRQTNIFLLETGIYLGLINQQVIRFRFDTFEDFNWLLQSGSYLLKEFYKNLLTIPVIVKALIAILVIESYLNVLRKSFINTFKEIQTATSSYLSKTFSVIRKFATSIKKEFYDLYIYLVGNSVWPDTIEGILAWSTKLKKFVLPIITNFVEKVKSSFSKLYRFIRDISNSNSTLDFSSVFNFDSSEFKSAKLFLTQLTDQVVSFAKQLKEGVVDRLAQLGSLDFSIDFDIKLKTVNLLSSFISLVVMLEKYIAVTFGEAILNLWVYLSKNAPILADILGIGIVVGLAELFGVSLLKQVKTLALAGLVATVINEVSSAVGELLIEEDFFTKLGQNFGSLLGSIITTFISNLPLILQGLLDVAKGFAQGLLAELGILGSLVSTILGLIGGAGSIIELILFGAGVAVLLGKFKSIMSIVNIGLTLLLNRSVGGVGKKAGILQYLLLGRGRMVIAGLLSVIAVLNLIPGIFNDIGNSISTFVTLGGIVSLLVFGPGGTAKGIIKSLDFFMNYIGLMSGLMAINGPRFNLAGYLWPATGAIGLRARILAFFAWFRFQYYSSLGGGTLLTVFGNKLRQALTAFTAFYINSMVSLRARSLAIGGPLGAVGNVLFGKVGRAVILATLVLGIFTTAAMAGQEAASSGFGFGASALEYGLLGIMLLGIAGPKKLKAAVTGLVNFIRLQFRALVVGAGIEAAIAAAMGAGFKAGLLNIGVLLLRFIGGLFALLFSKVAVIIAGIGILGLILFGKGNSLTEKWNNFKTSVADFFTNTTAGGRAARESIEGILDPLKLNKIGDIKLGGSFDTLDKVDLGGLNESQIGDMRASLKKSVTRLEELKQIYSDEGRLTRGERREANELLRSIDDTLLEAPDVGSRASQTNNISAILSSMETMGFGQLPQIEGWWSNTPDVESATSEVISGKKPLSFFIDLQGLEAKDPFIADLIKTMSFAVSEGLSINPKVQRDFNEALQDLLVLQDQGKLSKLSYYLSAAGTELLNTYDASLSLEDRINLLYANRKNSLTSIADQYKTEVVFSAEKLALEQAIDRINTDKARLGLKALSNDQESLVSRKAALALQQKLQELNNRSVTVAGETLPLFPTTGFSTDENQAERARALKEYDIFERIYLGKNEELVTNVNTILGELGVGLSLENIDFTKLPVFFDNVQKVLAAEAAKAASGNSAAASQALDVARQAMKLQLIEYKSLLGEITNLVPTDLSIDQIFSSSIGTQNQIADLGRKLLDLNTQMNDEAFISNAMSMKLGIQAQKSSIVKQIVDLFRQAAIETRNIDYFTEGNALESQIETFFSSLSDNRLAPLPLTIMGPEDRDNAISVIEAIQEAYDLLQTKMSDGLRPDFKDSLGAIETQLRDTEIQFSSFEDRLEYARSLAENPIDFNDLIQLPREKLNEISILTIRLRALQIRMALLKAFGAITGQDIVGDLSGVASAISEVMDQIDLNIPNAPDTGSSGGGDSQTWYESFKAKTDALGFSLSEELLAGLSSNALTEMIAAGDRYKAAQDAINNSVAGEVELRKASVEQMRLAKLEAIDALDDGTFSGVTSQFDALGASLDASFIGSLTPALLDYAQGVAKQIELLRVQSQTMEAGSVELQATTAAMDQLKMKLEELQSSSKVMSEAFQTGMADFLKGEKTFKGFLDSLLDTFTNTIIEKFSKGFTDSLFSNLGLDQLFTSLFSGALNLGTKAGDTTAGALSVFGELGASALRPMFVKDVSQEGVGVEGVASNEGFFSKLFSGIQGFFGKLFSGIGNALSGLFGGGGGGGLFSLFKAAAPAVAAATGGYISGPGGPTSDSIMAMLSNGEYVVNAATTKRWLPFLETLNSNDGRLPAFAGGGSVGPSNPVAFKVSQRENNNKNKQQQVFNINVTGDVSMQARKEIARMIPEITAGVNMTNRERGSR